MLGIKSEEKGKKACKTEGPQAKGPCCSCSLRCFLSAAFPQKTCMLAEDRLAEAQEPQEGQPIHPHLPGVSPIGVTSSPCTATEAAGPECMHLSQPWSSKANVIGIRPTGRDKQVCTQGLGAEGIRTSHTFCSSWLRAFQLTAQGKH